MSLTARKLSAFLGLCKLRVVALIVFTALVGMALATPGWIPAQPLILGGLGIAVMTSVGSGTTAFADKISSHMANDAVVKTDYN